VVAHVAKKRESHVSGANLLSYFIHLPAPCVIKMFEDTKFKIFPTLDSQSVQKMNLLVLVVIIIERIKCLVDCL